MSKNESILQFQYLLGIKWQLRLSVFKYGLTAHVMCKRSLQNQAILACTFDASVHCGVHAAAYCVIKYAEKGIFSEFKRTDPHPSTDAGKDCTFALLRRLCCKFCIVFSKFRVVFLFVCSSHLVSELMKFSNLPFQSMGSFDNGYWLF
jgi:hypothetical protein